MATVGNAIYSLLIEDVTVARLTGKRIFPLQDVSALPKRPLVTYAQRSVVPVRHANGIDPFSNGSIELEVFADTANECETVANEIKRVLGFVARTVEGVRFAPLELDNKDDNEPLQVPGSQQPLYGKLLTFNMFFSLV